MNIENEIEQLGGIEISSTFVSKKDNVFDVNKYLKNNNLHLPEEYLGFSLKYGFGQFNKDVVFASISKIPISYDDGTVPITFIYGWGLGSESLQETRTALLEQINSDYFVFAEGNPGDYLLINTNDNKIYYYSHDSLFLVANSFSSFIETLKINDNSEPEDDIQEEWFSDDF